MTTSRRVFGPRRPVALAGPPAPPPLPRPPSVAGYSPDPPAPLLMPGGGFERHGPPAPQTVGGSRHPVISRGDDAPPFGGSAVRSNQAQPFRDLPPRPALVRGDDPRPADGSSWSAKTPFGPTPQTINRPVVAEQLFFGIAPLSGSAQLLGGPRPYLPVPRAVVALGEVARPPAGSAWAFAPRLKQEVMPGRPVVIQGGELPGQELTRLIPGAAVVMAGVLPPAEVADPAPVFHTTPRLRFKSPVRPT